MKTNNEKKEGSRAAVPSESQDWFRLGYRYYPLGMYLRTEFGEPVWKISVDAGFSCPNVDGTVGRTGCIFCDPISYSPGRRLGTPSLYEQIDDGVRQLRRRHLVKKFIAYFQPSTNTYDTPARLRERYEEALSHPAVVGLAIGTRPDAVPDPVLNLIAQLAQSNWISLELGVQSCHDKSLLFLQRGHNFSAIEEAVQRIRQRKLRLGIHVILGIPGETRDDMMETADRVSHWGLDSIKLHHLYVVRNTELATLYEQNELSLLTCEQYAELAADFLERLSPNTVIDRLAGEMSPEYLIAPDWTAHKHQARNQIESILRARNSWQGKRWQ